MTTTTTVSNSRQETSLTSLMESTPVEYPTLPLTKRFNRLSTLLTLLASLHDSNESRPPQLNSSPPRRLDDVSPQTPRFKIMEALLSISVLNHEILACARYRPKEGHTAHLVVFQASPATPNTDDLPQPHEYDYTYSGDHWYAISANPDDQRQQQPEVAANSFKRFSTGTSLWPRVMAAQTVRELFAISEFK